MNQYVSLYIIDKIVSTNVIKLQLPTSMKIYLVVSRRNQRVESRKNIKQKKS